MSWHVSKTCRLQYEGLTTREILGISVWRSQTLLILEKFRTQKSEHGFVENRAVLDGAVTSSQLLETACCFSLNFIEIRPCYGNMQISCAIICGFLSRAHDCSSRGPAHAQAHLNPVLLLLETWTASSDWPPLLILHAATFTFCHLTFKSAIKRCQI